MKIEIVMTEKEYFRYLQQLIETKGIRKIRVSALEAKAEWKTDVRRERARRATERYLQVTNYIQQEFTLREAPLGEEK